jgi:hypothetical protein
MPGLAVVLRVGQQFGERMQTKFLRGLVAAMALWLSAGIHPATAQGPSTRVVAAAPASEPASEPDSHGVVLALAGLGVVVFLAGRRAG